jgi:hypothetical protein
MTLTESQAERVVGAFAAGADWALAGTHPEHPAVYASPLDRG